MKTKSQQGFVLIYTLMLAVVILGVAAMYLRRVKMERDMARRSLDFNCALHLAEAGVEEAMWALNQHALTSGDGWESITDAVTKVVETRGTGDAIELGGGSTGQLRIRIDDPASDHPIVTASGVVTHPLRGSITRQVRVTLEKLIGDGTNGGGGGAGAFGLISENNIVMNNSAYIDSYDSDRGPWNLNSNRADRIVVVSTKGRIQIQNSNVYGQAAVGSASPNDVSVTQGSLTNTETSAGTRFDTNLITTKVVVNLPAVPPSPVNSGDTFGTVLPQNLPNSTLTLGVPGSTTPMYYYTTGQNVNLNGNTAFRVVGPVVLVVNGQLTLNGDGIQVENSGGAALTLYVSGNINANGNGNTPAFNNKTGKANNLVVFANGAAGQNLALNGAGNSTFAFYGPKYNVNVNGNGHWSGSVVAKYISLGGSFHYDERVDALNPGTPITKSDTAVFAVTSWRELSAPNGYYARDHREPF